MADPQTVHGSATRMLSVVMIVIGIALVAQAFGDGSPLTLRLLLGVLFVVAGGGRLFVLRARQRARNSQRAQGGG